MPQNRYERRQIVRIQVFLRLAFTLVLGQFSLMACSYTEAKIDEAAYLAALEEWEARQGQGFEYIEPEGYVPGLTLHVGPDADTCPHGDDEDKPELGCNYYGAQGLMEAVNTVNAQDDTALVEIVLHRNADTDVFYLLEELKVSRTMHIHGVPGSYPADIQLEASCPDGRSAMTLEADGVVLHGFSILAHLGCSAVISAWPDPRAGVDANASAGVSSGHLFENLVVRALSPDDNQQSAAIRPFWLGAQTILRNSLIYGYLNIGMALQLAHDSTLSNNTFVSFQSVNSRLLAEDAQNLSIVGNVGVVMGRSAPRLVAYNNCTTGLVVRDNLLRGLASEIGAYTYDEEAAVDGCETPEDTTLSEQNAVLPGAIYSPLDPRVIRARAWPAQANDIFGGTSLDGEALLEGFERVPGAIQEAAPRDLPVMLAEVGDNVDRTPGASGAQGVFVHTSTANALQKALWSVWPGGVVRLAQNAEINLYGSAVMSWRANIEGIQPGTARHLALVGGAQDSLLRRAQTYAVTPAALWISRDVDGDVHLKDFTIKVLDDGSGIETAIVSEVVAHDRGWRYFERIKVLANGAQAAAEGIRLHDRSVVRDTVVAGNLDSCLRYIPRELPSGTEVPEELLSQDGRTLVWHLTCRMASQTMQGAIVMPSIQGLFANSVFSLDGPDAQENGNPIAVFVGADGGSAAADWGEYSGTVLLSNLTYAGSELLPATSDGRFSQDSTWIAPYTGGLDTMFLSVDDHRLQGITGTSNFPGRPVTTVLTLTQALQLPDLVGGPGLYGFGRESGVTLQGAYSLNGTLAP